MATPRESLIPNSTQVPNVLLDLVIPRLPSPEHGIVLLYICRRTFGFGKKSDRIGLSQFVKGIKSKEGEQLDHGAGISLSTVRRVLEDLEAAGIVLRTAGKNGVSNGYRINLAIEAEDAVKKALASFNKRSTTRKASKKQPTLFGANNPVPLGSRVFPGNTPPCSSKEQGTLLPRGTIQNKGNKEKQSIAGEAPAPSRFNEFLKWYEDLATRTRGLKLPLKVTAAGKSNLGKFLQKYRPEWDLMEQLALYFLVDPHYRQFSPGLETFLSAGIMNGLLNDASNREDFWKKVDGYVVRYLRMGETEAISEQQRQHIATSVADLLAGMKMPVVTVDE